MDISKLVDFINVDPNIQFGKPVFKGTRVPVQSLFWHLQEGISISDFLEDFPSVSLEQAEGVMVLRVKYLNQTNNK